MRVMWVLVAVVLLLVGGGAAVVLSRENVMMCYGPDAVPVSECDSDL